MAPRSKLSPDDVSGTGAAPAESGFLPGPPPAEEKAADPEPAPAEEKAELRKKKAELEAKLQADLEAAQAREAAAAAEEEIVGEPDELYYLPWLGDAIEQATLQVSAAMESQRKAAYRAGFEEASRLFGSPIAPDTIRVRVNFEKQAKGYNSDTTVEITSFDGDEVRIMQRVFSMQEEAGRRAKSECDRRWAADQGYGTGKPFPEEPAVQQERIERQIEKAGSGFSSKAEPPAEPSPELEKALLATADKLGIPDAALPEPPSFPEDPGGDIDDIPF